MDLTQQELAAKAGVEASLISRLETDTWPPSKRKRPSYEALVRISRALNLAPDELFPIDVEEKSA